MNRSDVRFPTQGKNEKVKNLDTRPERTKQKNKHDRIGIIMYLNEPEDPANLGIFRVFFGILMMIDIPQERGMSSIYRHWGDRTLCFFPLFDCLKPLPVEWMYVVYLVMFLGALGIALGFCYRSSCVLFITTYWYIFFLDKTVWNNHSYLYGLISIMLLLTDGNRYWSIDGYFNDSIRNTYVPRWNYWLIKFQIFLVYFFAGLKKIDMDWMSGYSMSGLAKQWVFDPFRLFVSDEFIELYMVHIIGLLFDLFEGFLLLFDKTRPVALFFGCMFHLMNSQMFHIGMFPWTMLATMPFFLRSDWPRRLSRAMPTCLSLFLPQRDDPKVNTKFTNEKNPRRKQDCKDIYVSLRKYFLIGVASIYVIIQLFLPWSHFITQGFNSWTNGLYGYSWDMMVHSWSTQHIRIELVDKATNASHYLIPGIWIHGRSNKRGRWSSQPDMVKQYANCLAKKLSQHEELNITEPAIYFDVWRSMNGRFQQRLLDPRVDMVKAEWSPFKMSEWILPLMVELSPWRTKLDEIEKETVKSSNFTDVVFVADFPGLNLVNFVKKDINATITVLDGLVIVEQEGHNVTLEKNEILSLNSNQTHIVHTISKEPSCWMYIYTNKTLAENITLQEIEEKEISAIKENETLLTTIEDFIMEKMHIFAEKIHPIIHSKHCYMCLHCVAS
ncbi:vitamin K-dependent gamma-carboxylase-like isoform X2 [Xenia sp. Carnegie-2017]|uniref:vitamin K-dependent gamma-carboxylase-like isoform X2 n=1 Tax=Xenia sp. Carnegie-2017 TaxID=2897299 RepID=UPI001F04B397|nr:vitamin K-dependent gamma-carboxylase-like isoform X2 [Xenia sp. Carnegie-2017]XP_046860540.1 vitamin K-dependent gamma-carboxylase-like isoform X2 [Xenia sp. Carnegie-2017]XP_046860549.1 vitamin K-dependent gamma-carboxylase-like isoform X2 [Xenia sp. Carnegie-2017]XP_046860556.1 vitamin K-dependent gamma-carboxylase-like isoform X2 [Xenia sp. Carnegie-2017]